MPNKTKPKKSKAIPQVYRQNLDIMLLLVTYQPFQREAYKLRATFNIPELGFDNSNEPKKGMEPNQLTRWHRTLEGQDEAQADSQEFRRQLFHFYRQLEENEISYSEYKDKVLFLNNSLPLNRWHTEIFELIRKYNLPKHFEKHVSHYVLTNDITAPAQNFTLKNELVFKHLNDKQGNRTVSVVFHRLPTMMEWHEIRRTVGKYIYAPKLKNMPRQRSRTTIDRDVKIISEASLKLVDGYV